ncbi:hypothetical protein L6452_05323 [Arctium lappa]|uniref:Uncharacterized protein n=1 Tax=Arctium lappa TaxID=4217 RepID=A0ACB9EGE0_ARCLA|nr:hypothetical protein L6452_05323 [Arctium lappa]
MSCLGIRHGGLGDCMIRKHAGGYPDERSGRVSGSTRHQSLTFPNLAVKPPNRGVSTAVNATALAHRSALSLFDGDLDLQTERIDNTDDDKYNDRTFIESPRVSEKLDEWMANTVTEIVKNIRQAPLLVQIYADGEVKTNKSLAANEWPELIKHRSSSSLEGVILVEELEKKNSDGEFDEEDGSTRAFGVLVQGKMKGRDQCKSTCYLLKTSSVNGGGLGHICSHFCLMKVQNFHKSAFSQFSDCWLLQ